MSPQRLAVDRTVLVLLSLASLAMPAAAVDAGGPAEAAGCTTTGLSHESRELICPVAAHPQARRLRLQVSFSGGHDDTIASIAAPTVDGVTQECVAGSKTRLVGEDGDVSVDCLIVLEGSGKPRQLVAVFKWTHAEYTRSSITAW